MASDIVSTSQDTAVSYMYSSSLDVYIYPSPVGTRPKILNMELNRFKLHDSLFICSSRPSLTMKCGAQNLESVMSERRFCTKNWSVTYLNTSGS